MSIRLFSGLSLSELEAKKIIPQIDFQPPIRRGDIEKCISDKVQVCVIVDGVFLQEPAITPSEIMEGIRSGMKIYGSSSMGALRASELKNYGMIGHGRVFEEICKTNYFRDDFLGQGFDSTNRETFSFPYLDIKYSCESLQEDGFLSASDLKIILETMEKIHFSKRCIPELYQVIKQQNASNSQLLEKIKDLPNRLVSTKKSDAKSLLNLVLNDLRKIKEWNNFVA